MKSVSILKIWIVLTLLFFNSKQVKNLSGSSKWNKLMMGRFDIGLPNIGRINRQKVLQETQKKQENLREEEETMRRKILNERLMPLTRGNSFMRDFYSGRY